MILIRIETTHTHLNGSDCSVKKLFSKALNVLYSQREATQGSSNPVDTWRMEATEAVCGKEQAEMNYLTTYRQIVSGEARRAGPSTGDL
jgi:hypothetical protein